MRDAVIKFILSQTDLQATIDYNVYIKENYVVSSFSRLKIKTDSKIYFIIG